MHSVNFKANHEEGHGIFCKSSVAFRKEHSNSTIYKLSKVFIDPFHIHICLGEFKDPLLYACRSHPERSIRS